MRPTDRKYLKSHEWCLIEGDVATLGITDHAINLLSDLIYLELPDVGAKVKAGEPYGEIESVKSVSDIYSPVTGEVIATNDELVENVMSLAEDAFDRGWMIKVRVEETSPDLLDAKAYEELVQAEGE
ncbi:MAG: glycine cleavage system protein GcvH [Planctomycetes bacterium]|nr:glycine cleavage system protein GcvH [Planctomycetota bacterium]MCB9888660.1 glycine cleavage system protein GcvH [Planctomycetota bacterium]